jgi:hypothetical protein
MKPTKTLHIERLVLHGFSAGNPAHITEALRIELQRLITENAPTDSARLHRLDGGGIPVRAGDRPEAVGTQAARQLHRSLGAAAGSGTAPHVAPRGGSSRGGRT